MTYVTDDCDDGHYAGGTYSRQLETRSPIGGWMRRPAKLFALTKGQSRSSSQIP